MTKTDFLQQMDLLCTKYGYRLLEPATNYYDWNYGKTVYIFETKLAGKPDSIVSFKEFEIYTLGKNIGTYDFEVSYNSVSSFYSPMGTYNFISKEAKKQYHGEKGLDKFNWEIFEKWLDSQSQIINLSLKLYKEKELKKKLKKIGSDF